jgi:RNA polymerase sigma factor (TIGR02999 family)
MSRDLEGQCTRLLRQADHPNRAEALIPIVYEELRAIARRRLANERAGHTLQATALVNEVYMRLLGGNEQIPWNDRLHFFNAAAQAMRHLLLEHARNRGRQKRGGGRQRVPLDVIDLAVVVEERRVVEVDEAITRLEARDAALAQLVKLRFFTGLTAEETAQALGVSVATVRRDWKLARAWLARELGDEADDDNGARDDQ